MRRGRRHRAARVIAAGVVAAALAACGPDAAPGDDGDSARAGSPPHQPGPRNRAAPPSATVTADDVARFAAAWLATEDASVRERLAAEFAGRGASAVDALIEWYVAEPTEDAWNVLHRFVEREGPRAFAVLAGALGRFQPEDRSWAARFFATEADAWRFDPAGADVCRALLTAARTSDGDAPSSLLDALSASRPAARAVAADIGRLFADAPAEARRGIVACIEALGTDAAAAAPALLECLRAEPSPAIAEDGTRDVPDVVRALRAIGPAAPEILPELARILAEGPRERKLDACTILADWGDAASTLAPAMVQLLADDTLRVGAARVLRGMPSVAESLVVEVLAAGSRPEDVGLRWDGDEVLRLLRVWLRDPAVSSRVIREAASFSPAAADVACDELTDVDPRAGADLARALIAHADPRTRAWAARRLARLAGGRLPPELAPLLSDPEPLVRVWTATALAEHGALPAQRVTEVVLPYSAHADPAVRRGVLWALSQVRGVRSDDLPWVLAALAEDETRDAAIEALGAMEGLVPSVPADVVAAIVRSCIEHPWRDPTHGLSLLDRIPGGTDALLDGIRARLASNPDLSTYTPSGEASALAIVLHLGRRAAPLRETIAQFRGIVEVDAALAAIAEDADGIANNVGHLFGPNLAALLRLGVRGRLAIVLYAGRKPGEAPFLIEAIGSDPGVSAAVLAASHPNDDDPHSEMRRVGAVRLVSVLAVAQAHAMLVRLAADPSGDVRSAVADVLGEWAARDPASVPIDALRALIGDASSPEIQLVAAHTAWAIGARGTSLVSALRQLADHGDGPAAFMASLADGRIDGDPGEALTRVRTLLAGTDPHPLERWELLYEREAIIWAAVGDLLASAPLTAADLPALLSRLTPRRDRFFESQAALQGIERLGAVASPAVPMIRSALGGIAASQARVDDADDQIGPTYLEWVAAAARALAAIGPAAREAIPDLQRVAAISGDPDGAVRDAIERLRAAGSAPDSPR